jgi:hypothetical protein
MVIMIDFISFNPYIVVIYRLESVFVVLLDHLKNNFQISHLFDSVSNYDVNSGGIVHKVSGADSGTQWRSLDIFFRWAK